MPNLRNFSDDEAALLRQKGIDPSKYYVDMQTGELYDAATAPEPTIGESINSGWRSVGRSFMSLAPQAAHLIGAGMESLGMGDKVSRSGEKMENWLDKFSPSDPRVSNWINVPAQVVGQLGQLVLPAGFLGTGAKTAATMGAVSAAGDTIHEERQRQELAGEHDANKALSKGLAVGAISAIPERYGMGRIFEKTKSLPKLEKLFTSLEKHPNLMRAAELAATTVPTEAGEEALQQLVVHGSDTTGEQLAQRTFWGGVGGAAGAGAGAVVNRVNTASAPKPKTGVSNADLAKGGKPAAFAVPDTTLDAMEAAIRKGHPYKPPGKLTPVDTTFEELRAAGVPMLRDDIRALFDVWGGNNANTGKLDAYKRQLYDAHIAQRPAKATETPEFVKAQQDEMKALEDQIDTIKTRYAALQKTDADEKEKSQKLPAGDRWATLNSQNAALRADEMKQLEDQLEVLVNQKASKLQQQPNIPASSVHPSATPAPAVMNADQAAAADIARMQRQGSFYDDPANIPLAPQPKPLEGQPVEPGKVDVAPAPVEPSPSEVPEAVRQALLDAVGRSQKRITDLVEHQSKLAQDPRRESPIQGIRQPVEDEIKAVERDLAFEMDQLRAAKKKLPPARPREVREFMQGATLPGMEGEQRAPFPSEDSGDEMVYSGLPVFGPQDKSNRIIEAKDSDGDPELRIDLGDYWVTTSYPDSEGKSRLHFYPKSAGPDTTDVATGTYRRGLRNELLDASRELANEARRRGWIPDLGNNEAQRARIYSKLDILDDEQVQAASKEKRPVARIDPTSDAEFNENLITPSESLRNRVVALNSASLLRTRKGDPFYLGEPRLYSTGGEQIFRMPLIDAQGKEAGEYVVKYNENYDSFDVMYHRPYHKVFPADTDAMMTVISDTLNLPARVGLKRDRPRNVLSKFLQEYHDTSGHNPVTSQQDYGDLLRRAYKAVAESREHYAETLVQKNPVSSSGVAVAGHYDPITGKITASPADHETALHESIHKTNQHMGDVIRAQLRRSMSEKPGEFLVTINQLGATLESHHPLYAKHARNAREAMSEFAAGNRNSAAVYASRVVDEALAQSVAAQAVGQNMTFTQQIMAVALGRLGFDVYGMAHNLSSAAAAPRWSHALQKYYSGFPVTWEMIESAGGALGKMLGEGKLNPVNALYERTRSVKSRLADSGPLGAYVASRLDPLFNFRDRIANEKLQQAAKFEKFVSDPQVVDWVFDSIDNQTENYNALPAEKRDQARELMDWSKTFIEEMRERDQYVRTGSTEPRLPEVIPGYLPTSVDQKVWEEIGTPEGYAKWERAWVDNWRAYRPQDSEEQARALFRDFSAPISSVHVIGGEPLFMAARQAHGVPLPRAMRDRNLSRGFQNYIHSYALDAGWTEMVQKDPLMRRAFGVKNDHHFEDHSAEDESAWPDETQWQGIRREADRVRAPWLERLSPDMPLGMPLLVRGEHGVAESLLASYAEQPANRLSANMKFWNGLEQIGSALLMQTGAGVRDTTMGVAELAAYVPDAKLAKQFAEVMGDYAAKRDAARGAGAVRADVYRHQTANIVSKAAYETARFLRDITGRNILDEFPRVFAYHAVREQVMTDLRESGHSPLAEEFGDVQAKSADEIADSTAAAVVNRIAPNYDARSLPKDWIPQTRTRLGMLTQLSTWGIARFNTWYEDHYMPALKDKNPNRLFRSLLFGTIGGAAASALLEELFKRKPSKLTWQEWMGLSTEDQQREAAPLLFSIIQTQGLLGVAGDIGLPLVQLSNRAMTGGGPPVSVPDIGEASTPSLIIAGDMLNTTADFYNYIAQKHGNIDWKDVVDLANEYAKVSQTWRDMQGWMGDEEKLVGRERRMYERLRGVSAVTGEKVQQPPVTMYSPRLGSKFSLSKEFNTRTGDAFQSLLPGLVDAARGGYVPNVMNRNMRPEFWQDVINRRGEGTARSLYQLQQAQKPEEDNRRNVRAVLRSLD